MPEYLVSYLIFAQADGGSAPGQGPNPLMGMMIYFVPIMLLFYFMMLRPNQRRERDRKNMLAALKKNDHVVTVGGIKGVVANVKPEEDEVVLRVDDDSGTKLRVVLSSIARVVTGVEEGAGAKKES